LSESLLGGLAGDAESGGDLGPGVAVVVEAGDGLRGGLLEFVGELGQVGEGFDVAGGDAAGVGADDAA
jgi:hypothetical protein